MDREELAAEIRADYLAKFKPNRKTWEEIDEEMRDVWRGYANTALRLLRPES